MKYIVREKSLITNKKNLENLISLKNFPVFIGCTNQDKKKDIKADMDFSICKDSGFIQLKKLLPLDLVYSNYHSEAIGGIWQKHHEELAKFISKFNPKNILEIGGSNATLAQHTKKILSNINWSIVEPTPAHESINNITIIKDYFDESFSFDKPVDTIIHSHVLEHLYNPVQMIDHMYNFLKIGEKNIFSIPNLYKWLEKKQPNTLNFEHTVFLTEYITDYLLKLHGFKIIEKKYFEEHSIFYATEKIKKQKIPKLKNNYNEYKKMFLNLINYNKKLVKELNQKIKNSNDEIYLFGGHIFSQYLLYFGLNEKKIINILDNSKLKQNKRLYGTSLYIKNPEIIKNKPNITIILKAGAYTDEITTQLKALNNQVNII